MAATEQIFFLFPIVYRGENVLQFATLNGCLSSDYGFRRRKVSRSHFSIVHVQNVEKLPPSV
jgi:hypothetical protein